MMKPSGISLRYLCDLRLFEWKDIAWGTKNGLLTYGDVVRFALSRINEESSPAELAVAILDSEYEWAIEPALEKVVAEEGSDRNDSADRWLFATLLHAFETASTVEGLLHRVEEIYADFNYPDDMYGFVPWLPSRDGYDPFVHTIEQNRQRLADSMYEYLINTAATFGVRTPISRGIPAR